jgi:hypothetical protein
VKTIKLALFILIITAAFGWAANDVTIPGENQTGDESSMMAPGQAPAESVPISSGIQEPDPSDETSDMKEPETSVVPPEHTSSEAAVGATEDEGHSVGHVILLYVPNRIMDVFDFARLRVRIGPGVAVGVRATKLVSLFAGIYGSVFVGLPGPRLEPKISLPIGLENCAGVGVSLADLTTSGSTSPNYSNTEFGASLHAILVGVDAGVDPVELLDLALGFLFIDIRGDDL